MMQRDTRSLYVRISLVVRKMRLTRLVTAQVTVHLLPPSSHCSLPANRRSDHPPYRTWCGICGALGIEGSLRWSTHVSGIAWYVFSHLAHLRSLSLTPSN